MDQALQLNHKHTPLESHKLNLISSVTYNVRKSYMYLVAIDRQQRTEQGVLRSKKEWLHMCHLCRLTSYRNRQPSHSSLQFPRAMRRQIRKIIALSLA